VAISSGQVELTPVTVTDLEKDIASYKGKVVYIDAWFLGCPPCRDQFPHTVQLHRKYAADGLVVMSVDIKSDEWKESREKVLKFLTEKGATFPNYIFQDRPDKVGIWMDRHGVSATPAVVAFNRDGRRVPVPNFRTNEEEEAFVKKLLGE